MTNKTTKHSLVTSVMALFLCFTMLLGTTYVFFNNHNTSPGSIVISGGTFKTHPLAGWYGDNTAEATVANGYVIESTDNGYTITEEVSA